MEVDEMLPVDQLEQAEALETQHPHDHQVPMEGNVFYADLTGLQYYVIPGYDGEIAADGYVVPEAYHQPPQPPQQIQQYRMPQHQQLQQQPPQPQYPMSTSYAHQQAYHQPQQLQQQQQQQQQQQPIQYQRAHVVAGAALPVQKPVQHSTLTPTNSIKTPMATSTIASIPEGGATTTTATAMITTTATMETT